MDAEALKIILDLQKQVTLYEMATNDLIFFLLDKKRQGYRTYRSLNANVFTQINEEIIMLKKKAGYLPE